MLRSRRSRPQPIFAAVAGLLGLGAAWVITLLLASEGGAPSTATLPEMPAAVPVSAAGLP